MRKRLLTLCFSLVIVMSLYSQNVGIGTPTPGSRLEVVGSETSEHGKNAAITIINTASSREWNIRVGATGTFTPNGGFSIADNLGYRFVINNQGNIGIGTTTPAYRLEVNGETKTVSLKVGNNGTSLDIVQKGTFTIGSNATAFKTVTVNFPNAFSSIPTLTATVKNDPGWNVGDTFVASIRSISTTSVTFNILRVDSAVGWSQNLLLDWIAVQ